MPYVTTTTPEHLLKLARNMRVEDVEEIKAASAKTPLASLEDGYINSTKCFTIMTDDHQVVGVFGVAPSVVDKGIGHPWLLATDLLTTIRLPFLKQCGSYVAELGEGFDLLVNWVDKRNKIHIKWLKWLGFSFIKEHERFGAAGIPFIEFVKLGDTNV